MNGCEGTLFCDTRYVVQGRLICASAVDLLAEDQIWTTVEGVEIATTGIEYPLASGSATFTQQDLEDAVEAWKNDSAVCDPRLFIGHPDDIRFRPATGEPAVGRAVNLHLSANKQTLLCDWIVPKWLADIMPVAYPNRSIEGYQGAKTATGKKWGLVIEGVALLGVHWPGISTLEDLKIVFSSKGPAGVSVEASVNVEDVRRAYYDSLTGPMTWWWIRGMLLDPDELIVDDDEGNLFRVPFSSVNDTVAFSDPVPVKIEYVDLPQEAAAPIAAAGIFAARKTAKVYATRDDSRPNNKKEAALDPKVLRASLNLPEDASDEQVAAELTRLRTVSQTAPPPDGDDGTGDGGEGDGTEGGSGDGETPPAGNEVQVPVAASGLVTLDKAMFDELRRNAERGAQAHDQLVKSERDNIISAAVAEGRFPPARKAHWEQMWDRDPEGTRVLLTAAEDKGGLAKGLVPVTQISSAGESFTADDEGYPTDWLNPQERSRVAAVRGGASQFETISTDASIRKGA